MAVKALQLPEGFTVRKVKGVLKVVPARKTAIAKKAGKQMTNYEIESYEDYDEYVMFLVADAAMPEVQRQKELTEVAVAYPEHAARMKAEADARRAARPKYLPKVKPEPKNRTFVLDKSHKVSEIVWSDGHQYRVVEQSNYVSEKEAADLEDLDPGINSGWYTKVELVS